LEENQGHDFRKLKDERDMMAEPTQPPQEQPTAEVPDVQASDEMTLLAELHKQVEEKQTAYLRVLADFQNFQRRSRENEMRARDHGVAHVARAIVPVLENMDLALGHDLRSLDANKLADAVTLMRSELLKALGQCGIERIDPKPGCEFDPTFHEAVMQQAVDKIGPGRIGQCLQAGYRLGEIPLRSAKVVVTPNPDA
jgi:molecular chaperone GrpE